MLYTVTEEQVTLAVVCVVLCSVLPMEPMRETGKAKEEGAFCYLLLFSWRRCQRGHSSKGTVLHEGA